MANWIDALKNIFFPPSCFVCGKAPDKEADGCLCRACRNRYTREKFITCSVCHSKYDECTCRPRFASPYIDHYTKVMKYSESNAAGKLVLAAKDVSSDKLSDFLASEMKTALQKRDFRPDVITYVPCSDESFGKKGFDHGEKLAKALGKAMGVPTKKCFVCAGGKTQKNLSAQARLDNSRKSIRVRKDIRKAVEGKRVLLVDDVLTTGASALVASVHLKDNGAAIINFVSFGAR